MAMSTFDPSSAAPWTAPRPPLPADPMSGSPDPGPVV
jgi:hypothetical protein